MNEPQKLGAKVYDLSHLDDVKFGAHRQLGQPFAPDQLFFGFLAAVLLPGGGLLVPISFLGWNFFQLGRKLQAVIVFVLSLFLSGFVYYYPDPTLRKVGTIVFGLGLMLWQSRLIRHASMVGTIRLNESRKVQRLMVIYFLLSLLAFTSSWTWIINTQMGGRLEIVRAAQSKGERDSATRAMLHFRGEVRNLLGRAAACTLNEQCRSLQASDLEDSRRACENWQEFNRFVLKRVAEAIESAEKRREPFGELEEVISIKEFLTALEQRAQSGDSKR
jgi:hypothetical protein